MDKEKETRKIKVLQLQTELNLACGVTRTISQIIKNSSSEFEHHLIALGGDGLSRFEAFNFNPTLLNLDRFSVIGTFKIFEYLYSYCKMHSIRIIHSHHRYFDTITWLLKPFLKVKTITSVQSKVSGKKFLSYKSDKLIACSQNIKKHLESNFKMDFRKIEVIYNSVELISKENIKEKKQLLKKLNIQEDKIIIGFVGRLNFIEKGLDSLLKSIENISKNRTDVFLMIVGNGLDEENIKNYIISKELSALVISSKENVVDYFNIIDVFVLPSRIEPFGIVLLESGLMKKPVIASNTGGIPEIIENEKTGLLFDSEDVEQLTRCIIRVINDKNLAQKLAENLYKKVNDNFLSSKMVEQYQEEYKKLIGLNVV